VLEESEPKQTTLDDGARKGPRDALN